MHKIVKHPLIEHRMSYLRAVGTKPKLFRELISEITGYLAYEALWDVIAAPIEVETPMAKTIGRKIVDDIVIVPILRAGMGMLDAMLSTLPFAKVGVLGMQRNEETAEPEAYYAKVPSAKGDELAILIDPMFATGGSAVDAVSKLKELGYRRIKFLCIVTAPEGLAKFESAHPDVAVYTAALDERLNDRHYIVPGLGDAGDRIFGTI